MRINVCICFQPAQTDCPNEPLKKLTAVPDRLCNRGRIDVIEMSVDPQSGHKYYFIYEDQQSKFVVLKALRSNAAKEVATKLLDVLAIVGAPRVLHSGNGRKFAEQVVHELRTLWNHFLILHGDAPKCEVSCRDFKSLLESWMTKNPARTWREGLNFVQILHNTTYRCKNGKIPCDVLFGRNVRGNYHDGGAQTGAERLWTEEQWIRYSSSGGDEGTVATTGNVQKTPDDVSVCVTVRRNENDEYCATKLEMTLRETFLIGYSDCKYFSATKRTRARNARRARASLFSVTNWTTPVSSMGRTKLPRTTRKRRTQRGKTNRRPRTLNL